MAFPIGSKSAKDARELYEMKEKATKYYTENGVPKRMEEILNSMFHENPADVYGHLANFFETFSKKPVITKLQGHQGVDSKGQPTLITDLHCMVKNQEKIVSSCISSNWSSTLLENAKVEDKDAEDEERLTSVTQAINYINSDISNKLEGIEPVSQLEIDTIVYDFMQKIKEALDAEKAAVESAAAAEGSVGEVPAQVSPTANKKTKSPTGKGKGAKSHIIVIPDEPREKFLPGSCMVNAVSEVMCSSGAKVTGQPLYKYIASLKSEEASETFSLPLPVVTVLQSGKAAPGKLNCVKEFMIVPKPEVPLKESLKNILGIYNHVSKTLCTKGGHTARNVNDIGALCPVFDKPEQGLDLLMEAMTSLSLTPGEDFNIAINIAAHEMFDFEKGKYEVMGGQLKSPEDYVEFLVELLGRYPAINMIIDPLRQKDKDQWLRLCDRVSVACYVVGDHGYHRPGLLKDEDLEEDYQTSGILIHWEQMNTLSDVIAVSKKMEEANNQIVFSTGQGETSSDFLADLAVGLSARFLKLGGACRGERMSKLNRLLQIEAELEHQEMLGYHSSHVYPRIELPPPPIGTEAEAEDATPSPSKKEGKKK